MTLHLPGTGPEAAEPAGRITHLVMREFDAEGTSPTRTIRTPVKVFTIATSLVPHRVRDELARDGIDLDGIRQAAGELRSPVTLIEVEEHEKHRKIVVSLEQRAGTGDRTRRAQAKS